MGDETKGELEHTWLRGDASRFVNAGGLRWHVQMTGRGPSLLLLHGTGSSSHSWARMMPMLADKFSIVAPDLPGQGLTRDPPNSALSLPGMANAIAALLRKLNVQPTLVVGHSAGAAVLIKLCIDRAFAPSAIISINGALLPFGGFGGQVFAPLARLLVLNPFVPRFLSWRARDIAVVEKLLHATGSILKHDDVEMYARLFRDPGHVKATLGMMANWDLNPLQAGLKTLATPLVLVAAEADRTVLPGDADRVAQFTPAASVERLPGLGHLAHEEAPGVVARLIEDVARTFKVCAAR